jgi:hypothetical protein
MYSPDAQRLKDGPLAIPCGHTKNSAEPPSDHTFSRGFSALFETSSDDIFAHTMQSGSGVLHHFAAG